jgi:purine-binding chemotaxis protein CheW
MKNKKLTSASSSKSGDEQKAKIVSKKIDGRPVNAQDREKILKSRARELAAEPEQQKIGEEYLEVVEFVLAYEKYGIDSSYVCEVYPLKEFTPLPCTPPFVVGITNVRGQIISVIDIKDFFNLPTQGLTNLNRIIVVQTPEMELGILADAIMGVRLISVNEIQSALPTLTDIRSKYLRGVTKDHLVILDVENILRDPEIIVHEEVEMQ